MQSNDSSRKKDPRQPIGIDANWVASIAPHRPEDGHKGSFGTLLIRAGSRGMGGAALMCCAAGLRSGTGIVRVYSDKDCANAFLCACPQAIFEDLPDSEEEALHVLDKLLIDANAVVFGPGLPPDLNTAEAEARRLIEKAPKLLLDAGALTVLANDKETLFPALIRRSQSALPYPVLTPHPGEFARLLPGWDPGDRARAPALFAVEHQLILVLKGHKTAVFTPSGTWYINTVGNDGLAKGGSGDVLAGLIGGFMAQGICPEHAAACGVYFHGLSGDMTSTRLGRRFMQPTDVIDGLPEAFAHCGWQ